MAENLNNNLNADELAALDQFNAIVAQQNQNLGPFVGEALDGADNNNNGNNENFNLGPVVAAPGGPANNNGNNNNDDDVDWPENNANAAPAAPAPPAAPPSKRTKFATNLTPAEQAALQTPRPSPSPKFGDDVKTRVEDALYTILKPGFDLIHPGKSKAECIVILRDLLQNHKAILSGGFLLKLILNVSNADWRIAPSSINRDYIRRTKVDTQINSGLDIDFYVNCNELVPFYSALIPLFQAAECIGHEASFYCQSFLRKNGIRTVYKCMRPTVAGINELDIMAVRNKRTPLDVVTNFDLTVCQVWYDGDSVKATDPEHVLNKVTYLQGDYVKTYIQGNRFLDWRLKKYIKRGFKIVADPAVLLTMSPTALLSSYIAYPNDCGYDIQRVNEGKWSADFKRKWLIRALVRYNVTGRYYVHRRNGDYGIKQRIQYTPDHKSLTGKIRPMDGYDTDDFIENIQLLRDRIVQGDPVKAYANQFLDLFTTDGDDNPLSEIEDARPRDLVVYSTVKDIKDHLDEVLAVPAATGGRRRLTRKRR